MAWLMPALAIGSALMSADQANRQQKQQKAQNMAAAAQTEFSPWTKMGQGEIKTGGATPLAGGLQGALGGFMAAKNIEAADSANAKNQLEMEEMQRKKLAAEDAAMAGSNPVMG